jgi:hypothetical protein
MPCNLFSCQPVTAPPNNTNGTWKPPPGFNYSDKPGDATPTPGGEARGVAPNLYVWVGAAVACAVVAGASGAVLFVQRKALLSKAGSARRWLSARTERGAKRAAARRADPDANILDWASAGRTRREFAKMTLEEDDFGL